MPIGGRVIYRLLFTLLLCILSLLSADKLSANPIPATPHIELNDYWTLCVKDESQRSVECETQETVGSIEHNFDNFNGFAIYKTDFTLDDTYQNTPLTLYIPHLRDADKVFLNGKLIGQTGQFPPNFEKQHCIRAATTCQALRLDLEGANSMN